MSDTSLSSSVDHVPPEDVALELNSHLDRAQLADVFKRTGRVHISNLLTDVSAGRLFRALEKEAPWGLIFNEGKETRAFETVSAEDHQEMAIAAWERAHSGFQYFYSSFACWRTAAYIRSRTITLPSWSHF